MSIQITTFTAFKEWVEQLKTAMGTVNDPIWAATDTELYTLLGGEPNEDNFWAWRELLYSYDDKRLATVFKPNVPVAFANEPFVDKLHFPHVSREDATLMAYTSNPTKGRAGIQTQTTVGKYLTKFCLDSMMAAVTDNQIADFRNSMAAKRDSVSGVLRAVKDYTDTPDTELREIIATEQIKVWADKHREKAEEGLVLFAVTRDEIKEVYLNGPDSCMDGKRENREHYEPNLPEGVHPSEAYAGPDAVVAYTRRNGKINARTVCHIGVNPPRYTRIFGDSMIGGKLQSLGFVVDNERGLDGARLMKIPALVTDNWVIPYLDAPAQYIRREAGYLVVSKTQTEYSAATRRGCIYVEDPANYETCTCCGAAKAPRHMLNTYSTGRVCSICITEHYTKAHAPDNSRVYELRSRAAVVHGAGYATRDYNFAEHNLVQLRDGSYTSAGKTVPHYLGGLALKDSTAVACGVVDGVVVYVTLAEITPEFRLVGDWFNKKLLYPGAVYEGKGDTTVGEFVMHILSQQKMWANFSSSRNLLERLCYDISPALFFSDSPLYTFAEQKYRAINQGG